MSVSFVLDDYDFELPSSSIAQRPVRPRHHARLLQVPIGDGELQHHRVRQLPELLPRGCLLVVNDTRVVPGRLLARKATGGRVELLLCSPVGGTGSTSDGELVLYRSSKSLRVGMRLSIEGAAPEICVMVTEIIGDGFARVSFDGTAPLMALLERYGDVPLPPYVRSGIAIPEDRQWYQCTYAREPGSVAAPTAGLHLSEELLADLDAHGIERCALTLHVGPGTFLPIRQADLRRHTVLAESFELSQQCASQLNAAQRDGRPIIAVGTTTTRVLEHLASHNEAGAWPHGHGTADLTILPGHRFRAVTGMMTNFHLPKSSLLVLACALVGRQRLLSAYRTAVEAGYRFYSYGDATLLI